jgi:hypothetical protein
LSYGAWRNSARKGVANRRGGRGKCVENRKKILNSGNEPKNMLKTQELSFSGAKNELVFEGKRTQIKAKNMAAAGRPGLFRRQTAGRDASRSLP